MDSAVIQVEGLSKSFFPTGQKNPFWALKDISFSVKQGDLLAIIGKNGSGKSTLLKILSEIYRPTTGTAIIKGKVASVLDIGTGFHPDLTGRENIFFYGALTGFRQNELSAKFDEIVELSGLAAFIDTPVRNYSNGMFVRLAVSVIMCLHYDVLILDEVVGAGDSEFRLKMADRMKKLTEQGTTILMASHHMNELFSCNAVLWLEAGHMRTFGYDKNTLIEYMEESVSAHKLTQETKPGNGYDGNAKAEIIFAGIKLNTVDFTDKSNNSKSAFDYEDEIYLRINVTVQKAGVTFPFSIGVFDSSSNILFGSSFQMSNPDYKTGNVGDEIQFTAVFPKQFFNFGSYFINIYGLDDQGRFRDIDKNVKSFTVAANEKDALGPRGTFMPGIVRPQINWQVGSPH